MPALRSLSFFSTLYILVLLNGLAIPEIPGLTAMVSIVTGFLVGFPVDRLRYLFLWATESARLVSTYRTCVLAAPWLRREQRDWRFIGALKERR